jgi:hypothetical protein
MDFTLRILASPNQRSVMYFSNIRVGNYETISGYLVVGIVFKFRKSMRSRSQWMQH